MEVEMISLFDDFENEIETDTEEVAAIPKYTELELASDMLWQIYKAMRRTFAEKKYQVNPVYSKWINEEKKEKMENAVIPFKNIRDWGEIKKRLDYLEGIQKQGCWHHYSCTLLRKSVFRHLKQ